jgi:hypothetical protein
MVESLFRDILKTVLPEKDLYSKMYDQIMSENEENVTSAFEKLIPITLKYGTTAIVRSNDIIIDFSKVKLTAIKYIKEHVKGAKENAKQFSDLMISIMNENNTEFNEFYFKSGKPYVKDDYDQKEFAIETKRQFNKFFVSLNNLEYLVAKDVAKHGGFLLKTMAKHFGDCKEAKEIVKDLRESIFDIYENLLNYGFWSATNIIGQPELSKIIEI